MREIVVVLAPGARWTRAELPPASQGEILAGTSVSSAELIDAIPDFGDTVLAPDGTTGEPSVAESGPRDEP
jgi:hypothetical protein